MVLDKIPNTKLFVQRDVRETPSSTATASAVGLTGEPYVLVSAGGADLTAERVLTAGEGIDLSDGGAGTTMTVSCEDATSANKGIASFALADFTTTSGAVDLKDDICRTIDGDSGTATASAHNFDILGGEGIDTLGSGNDITISMEAASTTNVGGVELATTAETTTGTDATRAVTPDGLHDMTSLAGAAWFLDEDAMGSDSATKVASQQSIKAYVDAQVAGGGGYTQEEIEDFVGGMVTGNTETNIAVTYQDADGTLDFVVADATTAVKGVASFNSDDFSVSSGAVSLANKTSYWSCPACNFHGSEPDTDALTIDTGIVVSNATITYYAPVFLPNGAVVTGAEVFGSISDETWTLNRMAHSNGAVGAMATANFNTKDTSISNGTIDNNTYAYYFVTSSLDNGDQIYAGEITYTTDYV